MALDVTLAPLYGARCHIERVRKGGSGTSTAFAKRVGSALRAAACWSVTGHGCSRIEWTTDTGNPGAQTFYESLGMTPASKIFYRTGAGRSAPQRGGQP